MDYSTAILPLDERMHVAGQISVADVALLARDGFTTIINNRPDGETPDQPRHAAIEEAAQAHGLKVVAVPVISGGPLDPASIDAQRQAIETAGTGKVLAFCRSGTRSTIVWALGQRGQRPADETIALAAAAGYDLTPYRAML
ncbi:MAG: TIGR01244 family sulfur transferase [Pseudomonadota bacterium]